jgi:hypothetical protein
MIPWDIHSETVYGPKPRCEWPKTSGSTGLRGAIYLELIDESGHGEISNVIAGLYGISTNPKSYRKLVPGESATIRLSGTIYIPPGSSAAKAGDPRPKSPIKSKVVGVFKLDDSSLWSPYKVLRSSDEFSMTVSQE